MEKILKKRRLCGCGCGKFVVGQKRGKNYVYIRGHNNRGKTRFFSEEHRRKISEANRGRHRTEEHKRKIGEASRLRKRFPHSEETKRKISESCKGRIISYETQQKINEAKRGYRHSEETKRKIGESNKGRHHSEETRRKMSESHKGIVFSEKSRRKKSESMKELWKNPIYAQKVAAKIKPNKPELKLNNVLDKLYPNEWKFVGDGQLIINGKCPDFVNVNGQKKIIELWGDYWHEGQNPEDRKKVFEPFGYKTLVIWESELKKMNRLEFRIHKFMRE